MSIATRCLTALLPTAVALALATPAQAATLDGTGSPSAEAQATQRPRAFFNFMVTGSMVHEDPDNRLTFRSRRAFITPGGAFRAGGVVGDHHLIGGLFFVDWRSTRTVLDSVGDDRKWGAISSYYLGPEYRYITSFGLYAGASLGFVYTFVDNHVGAGGAPDCNRYECLAEHNRRTDDQGIPGVGARAVIGYEYRVRRNLALNAEVFGGVLHGGDEGGLAMTMPTYGLALGIGF